MCQSQNDKKCANCTCAKQSIIEDGVRLLLEQLEKIQNSSSTDPIKIVIRGLPGSGKSTLAHYLSRKYGIRILENDSSHMRGLKYRYDNELQETLISEAENMFSTQIQSDIIFCDVYPVVEQRCSEKFIIVSFTLDKEHSKRSNIHNVPYEHIDDMAERWKPASGEILIDSVKFKKTFKL